MGNFPRAQHTLLALDLLFMTFNIITSLIYHNYDGFQISFIIYLAYTCYMHYITLHIFAHKYNNNFFFHLIQYTFHIALHSYTCILQFFFFRFSSVFSILRERKKKKREAYDGYQFWGSKWKLFSWVTYNRHLTFKCSDEVIVDKDRCFSRACVDLLNNIWGKIYKIK